MERARVEIPMLPPEKFKEEVDKLVADGWKISPDHPPVVIYELYRFKGDAVGMNLSMGIDDSKIGILRNGKIVG